MANQHNVSVTITAIDQTQQALAGLQRALSDLASQSNNASGSVANIGSGLGSSEVTLTSMVGSMRSLMGYATAVAAIFAGGSIFGKGLKAIDDLQSNIISTAAQLTSLKAPAPTEAAAVYADMKVYAQAINEEFIKMDPYTAANIQQLRLMGSVLIQNGVLVDVNNQKSKDGFLAIANALSVIQAQSGQGAGGTLQFGSELRAVLTGTARQGSELVKTLTSMDPLLKTHLATWKEEGTVLENLGNLLVGYKAATGDIQNLWSTITSSITTLYDNVLREGFATAFKDTVGWMQQMLESTKNNHIFSEMIQKAWMAIKGILESVNILYQRGQLFWDSILWAVGKIIDGFGFFLSAILPEIIAHLFNMASILTGILYIGGSLGAAMLSGLGVVAEAIGKIGKAAWKAITGDFDGAKAELAGMVETTSMAAFKASASFMGAAIEDLKKNVSNVTGGLDRIGDKAIAWQGTEKGPEKKKGGAKMPDLPPQVDPHAIAEANKLVIAAADEAYKASTDAITMAQELQIEKIKNWLSQRKILFEQGLLSDEQWSEDQKQAMLETNSAERTALEKKQEALSESWVAKRNHYDKEIQLDKAYSAYISAFNAIELGKVKNKNKDQRAEDDATLRDIARNHKLQKEMYADMTRTITEEYKKRQVAIDLAKARGDMSGSEGEMAGAIAQQTMLQSRKNILNSQLSAGGLKSDEVDQLRQQIKGLDNELETLAATIEKLNAQRDWFSGMKRGIKSYADEATNLGSQLEASFKGVFQGMEDALTTFVKTGKMSFASLADQIISDLIRIAMRAAVTGPLANGLGSMLSGMFAGSGGGTLANGAGGGLMIAAKGMAVEGGIQQFAKGGTVFAPTLFKMASGMGLMGEAGPEAVMPLTRGADGNLGVRSVGGNGGGGNVQVNVINESGTAVAAEQKGQPRFDGEKMIVDVILRKLKSDPGFRSAMATGGGY